MHKTSFEHSGGAFSVETIRYRRDLRGSVRRSRRHFLASCLGVGLWFSQRVGLLGEIDLSQQYAGLIGITFGIAALAISVREFLEVGVELSRSFLTIADAATGEKQQIPVTSLRRLHLSDGRYKHEHWVEVETDQQRVSLGIRSTQSFEVVVQMISEFYAGTTASRAESLWAE